MIAIAHRTLPTLQALFAPCRAAGVTADSTLELLRRLMAAGNESGALHLLNLLGFTWAPPKECAACGNTECACAEVEAVTKAVMS